MLPDHHLHFIEQTLATHSGRVLSLELEGRRIIVKRQESRARPFGYSALNFAAKLFQQPILCAVPAYGGARGQETEVRRLRQLHAAGVNVPEVLHVANGWIALDYAGETSIDFLLTRTAEPQLPIWEQTLAAILDTHQKGQMLSQAFARNMHRHENRIVFIDFEDDPSEVLSLEQGQTRDWLLFVHSTAYLMQAQAPQLASILQRYLAQDSAAVQKLIRHSAQSLVWLRYLPKQRKPWGRDVISLQGAGEVMHALLQSPQR